MTDIIKSLLRLALPHPDPLTRRRIRREAKSLLTNERWLEEEATSQDLAEIALRRVLWLQREAHRQIWVRRPEALALLARSAVETAFVGIYCLYDEASVARMAKAVTLGMQRSLKYLLQIELDGDPLLTPQTLDALGEAEEFTKVFDMATAIDRVTGRSYAVALYQRVYAQVSNMFVHSAGVALARHVRVDDTVRDQPLYSWTRIAARHAVDASVGVLAFEIAQTREAPSAKFERYGSTHLSLTANPVAVTACRTVLSSIGSATRTPGQSGIGNVVRTVRALNELKHYYFSGSAARDDRETRDRHTAALLRLVMAPAATNMSGQFEEFGDELTELLTRKISDSAEPGGANAPEGLRSS